MSLLATSPPSSIAARHFPLSLSGVYRPSVRSLKASKCPGVSWPRAAYSHQEQRSAERLWVYHRDGKVCLVGTGWANRAESTAIMLMQGLQTIHRRLAMASSEPHTVRLLNFERVVSISLRDYFTPGGRMQPPDLAYACRSRLASQCDFGLVPPFIFDHYFVRHAAPPSACAPRPSDR